MEQSPPAWSLQEGANSTLWCKFSTSVDTVQWLRQNPGGQLINLFYIPSGTKQNGNLNAMTDPKERHSSLYISSAQTTDSAIYFCAVQAQRFQGTCSLYTNSAGLSSSSNHNHITRSPQRIYTAQYSKPTLVEFEPLILFLLFRFGILVFIFLS